MRKLLWIAILLGFPPVFAQRSQVDSLRAALQNAPRDTALANLYLELAVHYRRLNFDSIYYFGARAHELSRDLRYTKGEALGNLMMGISQLRRGDLRDPMDLCQIALRLSTEGKFAEIEAEALNYIGLNYNYQGNYPTALEFYQRALSAIGPVKDKSIVADVRVNVGGIYYNLKDYDRALAYWKQALDLQQQMGNRSAAATSLSNIGLAYTYKGDYPIALKYYFQSLHAYEPAGICPKIYPLENIGTTYYKMGKLDSATRYYQAALDGAKACSNPVVEMGILMGLADVSKATGQLTTALQYLERAFKIGNATKHKRETSLVAKSLAELHQRLGNTKDALTVFRTYDALRDSIYSIDNAKAIGRLEAKYEYDSAKKEQEIARRFENFERERALTRERWIRNTFIGGFIGMLFAAAFIYRNLRRRRTYTLKLEMLNKEIKDQQAALIAQSEQLKQLNESLNELNSELERKVAERTRQLIDKNTELHTKNAKLADYAFINAHKLRAPVATILGLVKLFEVDPHDRDVIVGKIRHSTEALNDIVKEIRVTLEKEKSGEG